MVCQMLTMLCKTMISLMFLIFWFIAKNEMKLQFLISELLNEIFILMIIKRIPNKF